MGIDAHGLSYLKYVRKRRAFDRTITLGRQGLHFSEHESLKILGQYEPARYCEGLLSRHFGATRIDAVDASNFEGASIVHDLNLPLPPEHRRQYDTVIDGGCCEHIFDVAQALRNCSMLVVPGGQIVHILPSNNFCGHGFWQFSPELFFSMYSPSNGYADTEVFVADLLDTAHWYQVLKPENGRRATIHCTNEAYVLVRTTLVKPDSAFKSVQQSDYEHAWMSGNAETAAPRPRSMRSRLSKWLPGYGWLREARRRWRYATDASGLNGRNPSLKKVAVASLLLG